MTALNLDTAEPQRGFDLIPAGTICSVQMVVRMGGAGEGGWLKRTAAGDAEGLRHRVHRSERRIRQAQNLAVCDPERR